jgi:hypothetical protein
MKTKTMAIIIMILLAGVCPVRAVIWSEGYHQINDGDTYALIGIYNDVKLDIFGGDINILDTYNTTLTNLYNGKMELLQTHNNSVVNIHGGLLEYLSAGGSNVTNVYGGQLGGLLMGGNSVVNLHGGLLDGFAADGNGILNFYAYDVIYYPTGGSWNAGWVEGKYISDNSYISFDLGDDSAFSHITIIPEPMTIFLFGLGGLFIRRKRKEKLKNFY